jgi:hypothetical protein
VANWSAGAGLSTVLNSDAEMQPYILPGGSDAGWGSTAILNTRELPIPLQLPDWNAWLPQIHPSDGFGAAFTGSAASTFYSVLRSALQPNSTTAYYNALSDFDSWFVGVQGFGQQNDLNVTWTPAQSTKVYSFAQWVMVKQWELNQEFGLEGMPQVPFGSTAELRGWLGNQSFNTSPNMLHIPAGAGFANGTNVAREYFAYIWYHLQAVLNDGQGRQSGTSPIDYGYVEGVNKDLSMTAGNAPGASLQLMWLVKSLQELTQAGIGPQAPLSTGFSPTANCPYVLTNLGFSSVWSATSPSLETSLITDYVQQWFAQVQRYTKAQYYQGTDGGGRPWASASQIPSADDSVQQFDGELWYMLPRLRYIGVNPTLVNQISAWAANLWPAGNWAQNNAATCTSLGKCSSD